MTITLIAALLLAARPSCPPAYPKPVLVDDATQQCRYARSGLRMQGVPTSPEAPMTPYTPRTPLWLQTTLELAVLWASGTVLVLIERVVT